MALAPSWVLLERQVYFTRDAVRTKDGEESNHRGTPASFEERRYAITAYLQTLKVQAQVADPPEFSNLRMVPPTKSIPPLCGGVTSAHISSADKNLVALNAGFYRPGTLSEGCYLIYDAMKNSLSTVPQIPFDDSHAAMGYTSAVVVCDRDGMGYVLVELIRIMNSDVEAALYLWHSSAAEWVMKPGRLPLEMCLPTEEFSSEICFSLGGSILCWVDLCKGMVICDLRTVYNSGPEFRFIPLPKDCPTYDFYDYSPNFEADEFRSMAYVGGAIKFVTMDGYVENEPGDEYELALWTLSPDFSGWRKSRVYNVGNIWKNETHQAIGIPKSSPSYPVLSMHEDDVVYLAFTDIRMVGDIIECPGHYLLRVDMEKNTVDFYPQSERMVILSQPFASEFSAYMQGVHDSSQVPNP